MTTNKEYILLEPLQNKDAGFCRWTFARRGDQEFFLKEFIDPIYPDSDVLTEKQRKFRLMDCEEFCERKRKIYAAVDRASDGNLVRVEELFRSGSHYYITMPRIKGEKITVKQISERPLKDKLLLCMTVAHAIMSLHEQGVVHADIKDTNVLIKSTDTGKLVGKVIDFDCSFMETDPPETEDELSGDQIYLSPEACDFICGEAASLTCKMDVFALGLLFHQYLVGFVPGYDTREYKYAHEAVCEGRELTVSPLLPERLQGLIRCMLARDPFVRCDTREVFAVLSEEYQKLAASEDVTSIKDWINLSTHGSPNPATPPPTPRSDGWFHKPEDL